MHLPLLAVMLVGTHHIISYSIRKLFRKIQFAPVLCNVLIGTSGHNKPTLLLTGSLVLLRTRNNGFGSIHVLLLVVAARSISLVVADQINLFEDILMH